MYNKKQINLVNLAIVCLILFIYANQNETKTSEVWAGPVLFSHYFSMEDFYSSNLRILFHLGI